jgi:predicted permease
MQIWNDIRYALRGFRRTPLFTAVAILSLAFGIGANTAVFSLLDQVMLRLLPVKHPEQLVILKERGLHYGSNSGMNAMSYPMYKDFSEHNNVFSGMFCRFATQASLGFGSRTERVEAELVSGTYFPVLGVSAALGRTFTPEDDQIINGHPLVVLSYNFWQNRFNADPSIVNKTIVVNGHNMTVIGVAQAGFDGVQLGQTTKVFVPMMMKAQMTPLWDAMKDRRWRWVNAFGRLKPGVSTKQAQAALQPFMHSMLEMEVKESAFHNASDYMRRQFLKSTVELLPGSQGQSYLRQELGTPLWVLMALTGTVLLLACANLANLMLARAASREREMAVRLAIGAGRTRIIRQLLVESLLLSVLGATLGLALAFGADQLLLAAYLPADSTGALAISATPDSSILLFTFSVMFITVLIFGLAPAIHSSRADVAPTLKDQAGSVVSGGNVLVRKILVSAQVTLSLLLLIGAGLFLRTLNNLRDLGPGFSPERLVGFNLDPSLNGYSVERCKAFYKQLTSDLAATPGVQSVGLASMRILEGSEWDSSMTAEGYSTRADEDLQPYMNAISPNYFATLGVPIVEGRDFTIKDERTQSHGEPSNDGKPNLVPTTVIINESFAKKFFKGRDPIGLHLGFGADPGTKTDMEIIGVVKDMKYTSLRDQIPIQAYIPYLAGPYIGSMTVYVRTSLEPQQVMGFVRRKVQTLDANIPVYAMRSTQEQIDLSLRTERLVASLSAVFGVLATLLAVIGLYGVMAYTVARRTREIGIRMALGAEQGNVIWMVMREVFMLIGMGVLIGVPLALGLSRLIKSQLFGMAPNDPLTLAAATLVLTAVACLAGFIPALRASRVHPTRALRYE